jgi:hypothetical protein
MGHDSEMGRKSAAAISHHSKFGDPLKRREAIEKQEANLEQARVTKNSISFQIILKKLKSLLSL